MLSTVLAGFGTGASLIVAIGAQNAYVLRTGLSRHAVVPVVLVCAVSDIVLIAAGVAGIGAIATAVPWVLEVVRWAGVAFLLAYAAVAARRALAPGALVAGSVGRSDSRRRAVVTAAGLTWLNPHVYLDTLVLVGSVAATHGDPGRWAFGLGAMLASAAWFPLLGFGAVRMSGLLSRPIAWRILDGLIAVQLLVVAIALVRSA